MTIGASPARASTSAARTPAGPAPTMTTVGSASVVSSDAHRHAGLDERRAGAHAPAVAEPQPAVLARRHHAEAGAQGGAELEAPERVAIEQDRGDEQVALLRPGRLAVDRESDFGTCPVLRYPLEEPRHRHPFEDLAGKCANYSSRPRRSRSATSRAPDAEQDTHSSELEVALGERAMKIVAV